ncbi:hypothetical protein N5F13_12015 [Comamonas thiooxydans]|uniref:hypothetical protein n=1 Tax=Comamonas thiooxydans TaxID=363952 RepID=UPI00244AFCC9|nr:hypothetical protein [Comamonas thiooxydans]MDH1475226.1 hypothetical protein [Comamonas thiooxydans]
MTNQNNEYMPALQGLDVRDEDNHSLIELRTADMAIFSADKQGSDLDTESISQLNHLLSLVPSSVTAVAGNSKQLMTCSFDYSKLIQAKDGSGAIGGVYKEGTNQIGAQARFHEAENLKSVVNTGFLLNIASQALAQKHLADINERLKSIESQVKSIQEFLEKSRLSKIQAFQEHLQRIGVMLGNREKVLSETLQVLAQEVQDVRSQVIHVRYDLEKAYQQVKEFDSSSWFGSNDVRMELQKKVKRIGHLQREYLLGMQCLLVANLILYIKHGGNKEFVRAGNDYLAELNNEQGLLAKWDATTRSVSVHLSRMKPVFELAKSTQANAQLVESTVGKVNELVARDSAKALQFQQRLVDAQNPRVLLEIEGGLVVRGNYLS